MTTASTASTSPSTLPFPLTDFHVHLSEELTLDGAVALAETRGQRFGLLEHPGSAFSPFGLDTDAELRAYRKRCRSSSRIAARGRDLCRFGTGPCPP